MAKRSKKRDALYAGLVGGATKSIIGDIPKGAVDQVAADATKMKLTGKPVRGAFKGSKMLRALKGRATGRGLGGLIGGTATFPVFASGMADIKSGEKKRTKKGIAKVIGSGAIYGYGKGGIEGAWEAYAKKKPNWGKHFGPKALGRGATATALASALALGLAHKMKSNTKGAKKGKKPKSILPVAAALGGLTGAGKGLSETVIADVSKQKKLFSPKAYGKAFKQPVKWLPKTVGRGAAGAFGTMVLGGVLQKVLAANKKGKVKKASKEDIMEELIMGAFTDELEKAAGLKQVVRRTLALAKNPHKKGLLEATTRSVGKVGDSWKRRGLSPSEVTTKFREMGGAPFVRKMVTAIKKTPSGGGDKAFFKSLPDTPARARLIAAIKRVEAR